MENLRMDEFTGYRFISGLKFSPDGENAAFVVHRADLDENGYASNLWIYNLQEEQVRQLTSFNQEKGYIWLDAEHLLFSGLRSVKDQEKKKEGEEFTVFYQINIHGGEAQEAFRIPFAVNTIKHLRGTRYLFTSTYNPHRPHLASLGEGERQAEIKRRKEEKDFQVLEEIPFWSNGQGFTSRDRNRLYIFDSQTGEYEALTDEYLQVESVELNAHHTQAVLIGEVYSGKQGIENALYLFEIETRSLVQLTTDSFTYSKAHFLGEELICLGSDKSRYGINEDDRFHLVSSSGERRLLTPDFCCSTWNSVGSDVRYGGSESTMVEGEVLYFITTEGSDSHLNCINRLGEIKRLTAAAGSVDSYSVHQGQILLAGLRGLRLQEVYQLQGVQEKQVTHFNDWVSRERTLSVPQSLSLETAPGVWVDGWVLPPVNEMESGQYPAILNIHGGPKTVYGTVFVHEMQYWANQGYYVFFCNPRGSDGKGNGFADIRGKYGTIDYKDIMSFTDLVLEKYPRIDPNRVGVTGGSYGGYMTNWIIGHTHRFKAAVSQRSISNWVSMGFTSDIGYFFEEDQAGATPWTDHQALWDQSPLKYADQVQTPTLFIHSDEDYRCWIPEALQMFTALRYHGVESRLCWFRGENHELSRSGRPKSRIRRLREITQWFDRFLK